MVALEQVETKHGTAGGVRPGLPGYESKLSSREMKPARHNVPEIHQECSNEQVLHFPKCQREHEKRPCKNDNFRKQGPVYQQAVFQVSFAHQTSRGRQLPRRAIVCSGQHLEIIEGSGEEICEELLDAKRPEQHHLHIASNDG